MLEIVLVGAYNGTALFETLPPHWQWNEGKGADGDIPDRKSVV